MGHKEDFDTYYQKIWGERWEPLKKAFLKEPEYCALSEGLLKPYFMDRASQFPAKALDAKPGDNILDMCAAPGGKTLLLASAKGESGLIIANDKSLYRRNRLRSVINEHLPEKIRKSVKITGYDASSWGLFEKELYDKILLDAPCSSERHLLASPKYLAQWTPARTKQLAVRQFAMLAAALDAVKSGGKIVYCTCSVSPLENDGIIEKLYKKRKGLFEIERDAEYGGEESRYGIQFLPDRSGAGPIFYAIIIKK